MPVADECAEVLIESNETYIGGKPTAKHSRRDLAWVEIRSAYLKDDILAFLGYGKGWPEVAHPPRRKRRFARRGFNYLLLDDLREHPGQEVTPASGAAALGQPYKKALAETCLKLMCDVGLVDEPRPGHYCLSKAASVQPSAFRFPSDNWTPVSKTMAGFGWQPGA